MSINSFRGAGELIEYLFDDVEEEKYSTWLHEEKLKREEEAKQRRVMQKKRAETIEKKEEEEEKRREEKERRMHIEKECKAYFTRLV